MDRERSKRRCNENVIVVLAAFSFCGVLFTLHRPFVPGQWASDGFQQVAGPFLSFSFVLYGLWGAYLLVRSRRFLALLALLCLFVSPRLFGWPDVNPTHRFRAEKTQYQRALAEGRSFGDQHESTVDGRRLTYWRWMHSGIDNAYGMIHDPEDRLMIHEPLGNISSASSGEMVRIQRLEPHWYFVAHT